MAAGALTEPPAPRLPRPLPGECVWDCTTVRLHRGWGSVLEKKGIVRGKKSVLVKGAVGYKDPLTCFPFMMH